MKVNKKQLRYSVASKILDRTAKNRPTTSAETIIKRVLLAVKHAYELVPFTNGEKK